MQPALSAERDATPADGPVTLLFTDFVGSTELFDRMGDDAANEVLRTHFRLLREAVAAHGGREVKTLGDGLMVGFQSTVAALGCAVAMQEACDRRGGTAVEALGLRIGVNAGEVIRDDEDDYFGTAVVVAKRLCDRAEGGQVLVSELVRGLVGSRGGYAFRDLGPLKLKGLAHPVRGYELVREGPAAVSQAAQAHEGRPASDEPALRPAAVRIRLCGSLAVEIGGRRIEEELPGRQGRALVAYLAANRRRVITRDSVIEVLWPGRPPRDPGAALSVLLSELRRVLGPALLPPRGQLQLDLPEDAWIDVEAAEAAAAQAHEALGDSDWNRARVAAADTLGLLEGDFLAGMDSRWVTERRQALDDLRRDALECHATAALAIGGPAREEAVHSARRLTESWPYHESGHRLLMEALAAEGDTAEALIVFHRLRTLLRDDLGATPGPELMALHARLLKGEHAEPPAKTRAACFALPAILAGGEIFVGRGSELARLRELRQAAGAGKPRLALLAGEPGVGKTRLAAELARSLHENGWRVLYGRCDEEPLVPYQPFVEALAQYVAQADAAELRGLVTEEAAEIGRLVPELARRLPDLPRPAAADPATERYRLLEAVSYGLAAICDAAPLLLVLDDLHWADKPTLVMLRHVVRRAEGARLLIVGTYRETEVDDAHPLAGVLSDLSREHPIDPLLLEGLTGPDVEALVARRAGQDAARELAHRLHGETSGNPLFVEEMLRHLLAGRGKREAGESVASVLQSTGVPKTVQEVIRRRMSRLPDEAGTVLSAASIIGREFDIRLLRRVCDLPSTSLVSALEQTAAARLVVEVPDAAGRYRFSHALVRETLRARLPAGRRVELHLRVGEALEAAGARTPRPTAADLAHHFLESAVAGDVDRAVRYAARAAEGATAKLAYEEAARLLERALNVFELKEDPDELERCELLLKLGEARWSAGDFESSRGSFRRAAEVAQSVPAPEQLARSALGFGGQYVGFESGIVDEVLIDLLERALAALDAGDSPLRARVMARLAEALAFSPEQSRKAALAREAAAMARRTGDRAALADVLNRIEWASRSPDNLEEALALTEEIVRLGEELGDPVASAAAHDARISYLLELGDVDASSRQFDAFQERAKRLRQPYVMWVADVVRAGRSLLEGRLEETEELALRALSTGQEAQNTNAAQVFGAQILFLRREQGRLGELADAVESFAEQYPAVPAWRCGLAWVHSELGRDAEARRALEELADHDFADLPRDALWLVGAWFLAEAVVALDDRRRAAQLHDLLLPYARRCVVVPPLAACAGSVSRSLGRLCSSLSRFDEGAAHFEHALDVHARLLAASWLADTRLEYARLLCARGEPGDRDRARDLLAQAHAAARELGLARLYERTSEPIT